MTLLSLLLVRCYNVSESHRERRLVSKHILDHIFVHQKGFLPPANEVAGRGCFRKCVCVCPHVSITHDALDLTVQDTPGSAPSPPPRPKEIRPWTPPSPL